MRESWGHVAAAVKAGFRSAPGEPRPSIAVLKCADCSLLESPTTDDPGRTAAGRGALRANRAAGSDAPRLQARPLFHEVGEMVSSLGYKIPVARSGLHRVEYLEQMLTRARL
jgi:hypothetical protein